MLDVFGYQYKTGLVYINTLYELGWSPILMMWIKFKPVIMMYQKSDYGEDTYASFERLATEMWRIKVERDPEWMEHDGGGFTSEEIKKTFT